MSITERSPIKYFRVKREKTLNCGSTHISWTAHFMEPAGAAVPRHIVSGIYDHPRYTQLASSWDIIFRIKRTGGLRGCQLETFENSNQLPFTSVYKINTIHSRSTMRDFSGTSDY